MRTNCCLSVLLLLFGGAHASAGECGWLATAEVDRLFPSQGPWTAESGGAITRCKYLSDAGVILVLQKVTESEQHASGFVVKMLGVLTGMGQLEALPALGAKGFAARTSDTQLTVMGHRAHVAASVQLTMSGGLNTELEQAAQTLAGVVLQRGDTPVPEGVARCPYFDPALLARLLPEAPVLVEAYGDESCRAMAGEARVHLRWSADLIDPADMFSSGDVSCQQQALPELAPLARLSWACKDSPPVAEVEVIVGKRELSISWYPGRDPTPDERQWLVELTRRALQRAR